MALGADGDVHYFEPGTVEMDRSNIKPAMPARVLWCAGLRPDPGGLEAVPSGQTVGSYLWLIATEASSGKHRGVAKVAVIQLLQHEVQSVNWMSISQDLC